VPEFSLQSRTARVGRRIVDFAADVVVVRRARRGCAPAKRQAKERKAGERGYCSIATNKARPTHRCQALILANPGVAISIFPEIAHGPRLS
jgi:hypothetical protein